MTTQPDIRLRILDKTDKAIMKLPRDVKGAIYDFQHKFRRDPHSPGLQLKQLRGSGPGDGGARLCSARVTKDYRALLLHLGASEWLLLAVMHRGEVYENLERFRYGINRVTGGIEFVDVVAVEDSISGARRRGGAETQAEPFFAAFDAGQLRSLGIAEPLIPLIAKITTEEELLGLVEYAPQVTGEVLLALHDGTPPDVVLEQITRPVSAEDVDPADYRAALTRPATQVTTDDKALEAVLQGEFARWQVFLHPAQRRLVEREYRGPARVSGGPGTGKTIVALHRTRHLVEQLGDVPGQAERPVLLTTFNKNLAADLRTKLLELGGPEVVHQVDIMNIDRLANRVVAELQPGTSRTVISDNRAVREWQDMLLELGETRWDADFLAAEWSQVILGQVITSWTDYARARRAGRGRPLSRAERKEVWQLTERFAKRLDDRNASTHAQVAARAAQLEMDRARHDSTPANSGGERPPRRRYRHVVVDEAQDLHAAHWKLLRAAVAPGPNDIFCVGDTHQRIYANVVSLGSLGINIRGRASKLTLNYRTTREILGSALGLLTGETYDDLDGGTDDLLGYRSVLHGQRPLLRGFATATNELDAIVAQVRAWDDITPSSIAVCVPLRDLVTQARARLADAGIATVEITPDGPKGDEGVHIGTMHRFKGLEYQRMVVAGASEGLIPRRSIEVWQDNDPVRYRRERQRDRSLLFVAATRARDELTLFWHGTPSPFLPLPDPGRLT